MPKAAEQGQRVVATNRRARFDYEILERLEAGIVLTGSEVKSLRLGRASLSEAFARVDGNELWLENMHIPPYEQGEKRGYDPKRRRKLLLHRNEIDRLLGKTAEKGLALVPIRVYFAHGLAKVEIGLGRGKRAYEKRQATLEREHRREMERATSRRR
ncbi:MAG: SsrA-binding protein SmpB [Actinomycetota bacterium]|nr:SsrA-binding protein SmpB [Actinomycetota bacterium]